MSPSRGSRYTRRVPLDLSPNVFISRSENSYLRPPEKPWHPGFTQRSKSKSRTPRLRRIAVKDNINHLGFRTTCGSRILQKHRSPFEADVVRRLRVGNALVVGKTNLDEFGMGSHSMHSFFGPVRGLYTIDDRRAPNFVRLYDDYSVGGSSGGSAVAVASDQVDIALGTDTGGSVRLPAAYTGILGFKPSYGMISRWGVIPYANSLDTVGFLAKSVKKILHAFQLAREHDPQDPTSLTKKAYIGLNSKIRKALQPDLQMAQRVKKPSGRYMTLRGSQAKYDGLANKVIGVPIEYNIEELAPDIRRAWKDFLKVLEEKGCTIVPVSLPNTKYALAAYYILAPAEAASNLSKYDGVRYGSRWGISDGAGDVLYSETRGAGFGDEVKRRILLGSYTLSSEAVDNYFIKAQKIRRLVQRDFDRVFSLPNFFQPPEQFDLSDMNESILLDNKLGPSQVDFIVCPTAPTTPPTQKDVLKQTLVDTYMNDVFTVPASLAGLPAISIPVPLSEGNARRVLFDFAGMQIIGQYGDDLRILRMADEVFNILEQVKCSKPEDDGANIVEETVPDGSNNTSRNKYWLDLVPKGFLKYFSHASNPLSASPNPPFQIRRVRVSSPLPQKGSKNKKSKRSRGYRSTVDSHRLTDQNITRKVRLSPSHEHLVLESELRAAFEKALEDWDKLENESRKRSPGKP